MYLENPPGKQVFAFNFFLFSVNKFVMQVLKFASALLLHEFCSCRVLFLHFVSICSHGRTAVDVATSSRAS